MKKVNDVVVGAKGEKANKTELMNRTREATTDFIGDALAQEFGEAHLAEVVSGKTKKKYLFVTVDGVQLQVQVVSKQEELEITDENLLATYSADTEEEEEEEEEEEVEGE